MTRALLLLRSAVLATAVLLMAGSAASAQPARASVPFGTGERLEYEVRFSGVRVGTGTMEVAGTKPIRGREAWHTVFTVRGGTFFYKVNDRFESWFDITDLASLRHIQRLSEGSRDRERAFEIYPERRVYTDQHGQEFPTVAQPLDDGSFLYFIRTVPLEVGREYTFHRYFRTDRNPVKVRVLRRERVKVPAGEFDAIVVQPVINTPGIFSENGRAEVWLSDDDTRIVLQVRSRFSRFSLNLHLRAYRPAPVRGQ